MQTNLTQIAKAYFGSAAFFAIAGEGAMFIAETYRYTARPDYLLPAVVAFSLPALPFGYYLAGRVAQLARPPQKVGPRYPQATSSVFASAATWIVASTGHFTGQIKPMPNQTWGLQDTSQATRDIPYKEPTRTEFVFYEPGMRSQIIESRLYAFCKTAYRRQQHVLYGGLAANRVFSRDYFTKQARPRFPIPDYQSCIHILDSRGLIVNRYKGGELVYTPGITVETARRRWDTSPT